MYVGLIFILFTFSNLSILPDENMWCVILLSPDRIGLWSLGWIDGCGDSQYSLYGSRISINYSYYLWIMSLPYVLLWIWCDSGFAVYGDQISSGCAMWISWDEWFQHNSTISHFEPFCVLYHFSLEDVCQGIFVLRSPWVSSSYKPMMLVLG